MARKSYYDTTYNSSNPLRKFAQQARFSRGIESIELKDNLRILDFGCGDALFLNQLKSKAQVKNLELAGFEPYLKSIESNTVSIYKNWDEIKSIADQAGPYDYLTCFEVMEHFSPPRQIDALDKFAEVIHKKSKVVISVPIEKGIPSLVKNISRKISAPKSRFYTYGNIFKSVFKKPIPEFRSGDRYLSHMGFYYDDLEVLISEKYNIIKRTFSPFENLGYNLNSQVFYTLTLKE